MLHRIIEYVAYLHMNGKARILGAMKRLGVVCILVLAFAGLADSAYLAQHKASGVPLLCNIQNFSGCNIVAASQYSQIFGVPLAEFGVVFYSIVFILAALEIVIFDQFLRRVLQVASLVGVISSLYFTFVQVFLIGAFCIYCFVSAIITLLILIFASFIEPVRRNGKNNPPPSASDVSLRDMPLHPHTGSASRPPKGSPPNLPMPPAV